MRDPRLERLSEFTKVNSWVVAEQAPTVILRRPKIMVYFTYCSRTMPSGLPRWFSGKETTCSAGDRV